MRENFDSIVCAVFKTHGLTHVALAVTDAKRSFRFYQKVFGVVAVYNDGGFIQAQTPGSRDVIVFEENKKSAGKPGGVVHFGFRLTKPEDIELAAAAVEKAGGKILSQGEFVPGEPYLFFADPDGFEVEIWYELPTPVDPPAPRKPRNRSRGAPSPRRARTKTPRQHRKDSRVRGAATESA